MTFELDHIVLAVADMDAMLHFYLDVVGLQPHRVSEYRAGELPFPCARVNVSTLIDLLPPAMWDAGEGRAQGASNLNHFCLACPGSEWDALTARLTAAGVETEMGPLELSGARGQAMSIYVRDPDGNRVEFRHYD